MACMMREGQNVDALCAVSNCSTCGWNHEEHIRRLALLETKGLTEGSNGLKRLVLEAPKKVIENEDS